MVLYSYFCTVETQQKNVEVSPQQVPFCLNCILCCDKVLLSFRSFTSIWTKLNYTLGVAKVGSNFKHLRHLLTLYSYIDSFAYVSYL
uniref:Uncharacterized protein n=1 Tax=Arundo donax TaxID=35708 RepID=A0A0A9EY78_ARUDO